MSAPVRSSGVQVDATAYRFSHGHGPRGRGHWAFFAGHSAKDCETRREAAEWWRQASTIWQEGTYTAAKAAARKAAAARGFTYLVVGT